jgi:serine/threonine protein kinase
VIVSNEPSPTPPPGIPYVPPPGATGGAALGAVGGYDLLAELASGGMAMVFLGHANDGRASAPLVAVKRPHRHLASDKMFLSMLLDEARLASAIQHDHVVKVRELGFHAGEPFIVMDYVEGASLSELRKALAAAERAVETRVAVRVVLDALAGLHAAHELCDEGGRPLGIIHRDVSPHNVLIGCDGRARLTDFGIAKAEDRIQVTRTHEVKGKLAYLAPERIDKRRTCTKQSDVFSMAVVLWECLAGRRLFRGDEAVDTLQEVMHAHIPRLRQLGAQVPHALDDVIARGLSRDLDTRFRTALEFAEAIERAAGRANTGTPSEVARAIETVFGARLAARHEQIRLAMPSEAAAERLFEASRLPRRPKPSSATSTAPLAMLATISPPAPSGRYTFGKATEDYGRLALQKTRRKVAAGIAVGLVFGAAIALLVVTRHREHASASRPVQAIASTLSPAFPATVRRVVVPLPFLASHVELDDLAHDLDPASDVSVFDVPRASGLQHHVEATALDGTRADGYVREAEGVARVEGDGFMLALPAVSATALPKARPPRAPAPVGSVRNGFTKLN